MADPLAPQDIARASFGTARRGYEQQAVRGFLHEVSALVERLTRSEKELREQLQRAEARLGSAAQPDEATLLEILGAETTRVLTSAHEAAAEIRSKAEAAAERIIADATSSAEEVRASATREVEGLVAQLTSEAESLRDAARNEFELRKAEAHAAAERIHDDATEAARALHEEGVAALARAREEAAGVVEAAQQQGREMVAEAQAVRERVLRDLAVRRKRARQQVEKLNAGRERLLKAYATVQGTIDEATNELTVSITDARAAASAAARRVEEEPETPLEVLDAEVAAAGLVDLPIADVDTGDDLDLSASDDGDVGSGPLSGEVPVIEAAAAPVASVPETTEAAGSLAPEPARVEPPLDLDERRTTRKGRRKKGFEGLPPGELTVLQPPSPDEGVRILAGPDAPEEPDVPVALEAPETASASVPEPDADVDEAESSSADDVFARLREQRAAEPAGEGTEVEPSAAEAPVAEVLTEEEPVVEEPAAVIEEPDVAAAAELGVEDDAVVESPPSDDAVSDGPFAARAEAVAPIDKELRRRLKRALADEQNEVLDLLRRAKPKGVEDLLPIVADHAARWAEAATPPLDAAAARGAAWLGGTAAAVSDLADDLAQSLTGPLRERIDRSFAASDGNLEEVAD
ncbi:MAG: DivIVA domain-containing protein, partial [Microthrixaceae bacterium]